MAHLIQGANFSPLLPAGNTTPSQEQVIFTKPTLIFLPCDLAHGERKTPRENGAESEVGLPSRSHSRADAQLSAQFPSLKPGTKALPGGHLQSSALPAAKTLGPRGFAPHLQDGAEGRDWGGCCRAEKLQLHSFHTIPITGRCLDSLLLPSAGDK